MADKRSDSEASAAKVVSDWVANNPGVTLSFVAIAVVSLGSFLFFFLGGRF